VLERFSRKRTRQMCTTSVARSHYADLLRHLAQPAHRPRAVGLDILFQDPRAEDAELARAMALLPVVLPVYRRGLSPLRLAAVLVQGAGSALSPCWPMQSSRAISKCAMAVMALFAQCNP
jgi:hypothetical protein